MKTKSKKTFSLVVLLLTLAWYGVYGQTMTGMYSDIQIKLAKVTGMPKANAIQATLDGHTVSVVFLENLGNVSIEISYAVSGAVLDVSSIHTPNGVNYYIPNAGSYVITFTLPNGDEYYGEFEVTD